MATCQLRWLCIVYSVLALHSMLFSSLSITLTGCTHGFHLQEANRLGKLLGIAVPDRHSVHVRGVSMHQFMGWGELSNVLSHSFVRVLFFAVELRRGQDKVYVFFFSNPTIGLPHTDA